jgi:hypothetical protein
MQLDPLREVLLYFKLSYVYVHNHYGEIYFLEFFSMSYYYFS